VNDFRVLVPDDWRFCSDGVLSCLEDELEKNPKKVRQPEKIPPLSVHKVEVRQLQSLFFAGGNELHFRETTNKISVFECLIFASGALLWREKKEFSLPHHSESVSIQNQYVFQLI
jgi:hypothetical protein